MDTSVQILKIALKVLLVIPTCQPIHSSCSILLEFRECLCEVINTDVMEERGETSPSSFALQLAVCAPAPVTRFPGTVPGPCFADSHSPRPPPLAPPPAQPVVRLCSSASQLLWPGHTSHDRTSSSTAPRLPAADQCSTHAGAGRP